MSFCSGSASCPHVLKVLGVLFIAEFSVAPVALKRPILDINFAHTATKLLNGTDSQLDNST